MWGLSVFIGTFCHNMDSKNRVTIPRKILDKVKKGKSRPVFYLNVGMDKCLFMFSESKWQELADSLENLSLGTKESRDFQRLFFSDTHEVEVDGASRILIPDVLKEAACLKKEVIFLGAGTRIELWDKGRWQTRKQEIAGEYAKIAEDIF